MTPDAVAPTDVDETPLPREAAADLALRLAEAKARAVALDPGDVALAADTVVAAGGALLGKPADEAQAAAFLRRLSGRRHRVVTGVAVRRDGVVRRRAVETVVRFKRLDADEIDAYLASGEWRGKAGGYAIQGLGGAFAPWIRGSYGAVVGLPLTETLALLASVGWRRDA